MSFMRKVLIIFLILLCISSCSRQETENNKTAGLEYTSVSDLQDKNIGILLGSVFDSVSHTVLPDANYLYYKSYGDLVSALKTGKIDAFPTDYLDSLDMTAENEGLGYIDEALFPQEIAFMFNKDENGDKLRNQVNEFIKEAEKSGLKEELFHKWEKDINADMYDYDKLPGPNGTLRAASVGASNHVCFIRDGKLAGYEVELFSLFCEKYGYRFEYYISDISGVVAAVAAKKVDIAFGCLSYTEERAKNVNFSDVTMNSAVYYVVRKNGSVTDNGFIDSITNSFYNTFIIEDRYKLFISGCLTTVCITVLSVIFGTLLGFITYLKARNNDGLFNRFVHFMIWLIHGIIAYHKLCTFDL